jgi:hypothetical protein
MDEIAKALREHVQHAVRVAQSLPQDLKFYAAAYPNMGNELRSTRDRYASLLADLMRVAGANTSEPIDILDDFGSVVDCLDTLFEKAVRF